MASTSAKHPNGYTNEFGEPIGSDVEQWFEKGVKHVGPEIERGFCSKTQTLYVLLFVVGFIVLAIIIIVPIAVGTAKQT